MTPYIYPNLKFIKILKIKNIQYNVFFNIEDNSLKFESNNLYLSKNTINNQIMVNYYQTQDSYNENLDLIDEIENLEKSCIRDEKLTNLLNTND